MERKETERWVRERTKRDIGGRRREESRKMMCKKQRAVERDRGSRERNGVGRNKTEKGVKERRKRHRRRKRWGEEEKLVGKAWDNREG